MIMTNNFYAAILGYDEVRWFAKPRAGQRLPQQRLVVRASEGGFGGRHGLPAVMAQRIHLQWQLEWTCPRLPVLGKEHSILRAHLPTRQRLLSAFGELGGGTEAEQSSLSPRCPQREGDAPRK